MRCGWCHGLIDTAALGEHSFFEGLGHYSRPPGYRPAREWSVVAPLYYRATPSFTGCRTPYCGAGCSAAHYAAQPVNEGA